MNTAIRIQPLLIFCAALSGLLLGCTTAPGSFSVSLIEPFLMVLLFCVFLSADGQKLRNAFLNLRFTLVAATVNFVWTPLFAYGLGLIFLSDSQDLQIGLMMLLVTPCTDWYLVFTAQARGNTELGASTLPLNLLLQILLLPLYLLVFFDSSIGTGQGSTLSGIVLVLLVPFGLSLLLKAGSRRSCAAAKVTDSLKNTTTGYSFASSALQSLPCLPLRAVPSCKIRIFSCTCLCRWQSSLLPTFCWYA